MAYKYTGTNVEDFRILIRYLIKNNAYETFNKIVSKLFLDSTIRDVPSVFERLKTTYYDKQRILGVKIDPHLVDLFTKLAEVDQFGGWYKFFFGYNKERFEKEWLEWLEALHEWNPERISIRMIEGRPYLQLRMRSKDGVAMKIGRIGNDDIDKKFPSYLRDHLALEYFPEAGEDDTFVTLRHEYIHNL